MLERERTGGRLPLLARFMSTKVGDQLAGVLMRAGPVPPYLQMITAGVFPSAEDATQKTKGVYDPLLIERCNYSFEICKLFQRLGKLCGRGSLQTL